MEYSQEVIGKNIKQERIKKKWSQEKLGQKIHTTGKQISNYENGKTTPPIDVLFQLCEIFDCELGYLLGEENYSQGTQQLTIASNYTGLSPDAIEQITRLMGKSKNYDDYKELKIELKYEPDKYHTVLNNFFNSKCFIPFIQEMKDLENIYNNIKNIEEFFESFSDKIWEYHDMPIDETCDLTSDELNDLKLLNNAFNKKVTLEENMKIYLFNLHTKFMQLLNDLYEILNKQ